MKAMRSMGGPAMSSGVLTGKIAEKTDLKPKEVKSVLSALNEVAYGEVKKTEKFAIPQLVMLKLKHKPARKAGKKVMFRRQGAQGLDLSPAPSRQSSAAAVAHAWTCRPGGATRGYAAAGRSC